MQSPTRTPWQQVKDLLMATPLSSRQLAKIVGITEREVEDHISHITQQVELLERLEPLEQLSLLVERLKQPVSSRARTRHTNTTREPQYSIERHGSKQN
jgi:hypothetical protein